MRSQLLLVLLAATASARPVAHPDNNTLDARELEYSEVEALYAERKHAAHDNTVRPRELQYSEIEALYTERDSNKARHHRGDGATHHHHSDELAHHRGHGHHAHEFERFGFPHDHHHGGPHNDIVDNIVGFFTHQVRRSVPDVPGRVMEGIRGFLSHETRDVDEHEPHHPRHPHPGSDIAKHILDFFANATR